MATIQDSLTVSNGSTTGVGGVAEILLNANFNIQSLRPNNVLRKDEWIHFDNKVVQIAQERLVAVGDLLSRGLRFNLPNALGTTRLEWERVGDMTEAEISMSGIKEGESDRILFDLESLPVPIIHKDFSLNIRALQASRTNGQPLDTAQVAAATRNVSERTERLLFKGATVAGSNGQIHGYETYPDRSTGSLSADWASAATGAEYVNDTLTMIGTAVADNMYGPYILYVDYATFTRMGNDFKANSDKTILQRVREIPGIADIRAVSKITAGNVILVQLSEDVVDMVVGQQPAVVQWPSHGGMKLNFKVMAIMLPRLKSDFDKQCGIVHYSP